jgi:hypothetical protein
MRLAVGSAQRHRRVVQRSRSLLVVHAGATSSRRRRSLPIPPPVLPWLRRDAEDGDQAACAINAFATRVRREVGRRPWQGGYDAEPCWGSTTSPPNTGSAPRPPTPSSPRSRRCGCASESPKGSGSRAAGLAIGLRAHRVGPHAVASGERPALRPCPCRRPVQQRGVILQRPNGTIRGLPRSQARNRPITLDNSSWQDIVSAEQSQRVFRRTRRVTKGRGARSGGA